MHATFTHAEESFKISHIDHLHFFSVCLRELSVRYDVINSGGSFLYRAQTGPCFILYILCRAMFTLFGRKLVFEHGQSDSSRLLTNLILFDY